MPHSDSFLARMRGRLIQEKQELELLRKETQHDGLLNSLRDETGELSTIDNHPGDIGTEMFEREKDLMLQDKQDMQLVRVESALAAMEDGSYGTCIQCGADIPTERLEALPDTRYCIDHAPRDHVSHSRSDALSLLPMPFGQSDKDDDAYNGFDGEDAWQIVERWGNADSPAMAEIPGDSYDNVGSEAGENDGYVEPLESFLATDITGTHVSVVRNREYKQYMEQGEGEELGEEE
ncbi:MULTISPECIES: TraR/DksA C4-type zinc finger protein [unclassified Paenibacillus]|uniref:TraR/DksA C4-type zinc finger protein n=1 Tax=unclassified Paenibacillus TaxID=185978 RepID=UPI0004129A22|nr:MULTISPECIES: TraR/DksA C4-type zinc finger protein [unclassified Paenibacillus]KKC46982.1 molecular chaperone DnaK [Paenibacillus sp. D9]